MSEYKMIFRVAAELLSESIGIVKDEVKRGTALVGDPAIEPIDIAKYVMACEERFDVVIHDEDVHTFLRFEDSVRYIAEALYQGGQSVALATDEERVAWYYS
ncbi:MAG: hypothetical protein FWG40_04995 [Peptococcaceae bacterium]|nr:hypothetical protein [Peptococcaceae bacterium]